MLLSWGGFTFPIGWAAVHLARKPELNEAQQQLAIIETVTISGMLLAASPPALLQQIALFERAFAQQNQDLLLKLSDGSQEAYALRNRECVGGTRVTTPPSYPEGKGTEFVNRRSFQVVVEGAIPTPGAFGFLRSFSETLSFTGNGGPLIGHLEPLTGSPIKLQARERTLFRATQSGSAVGYLAYPTARFPLWPSAVLADKMQVSYVSPKRTGNDGAQTYQDFAVTWSYQFESAEPLGGRPGIW